MADPIPFVIPDGVVLTTFSEVWDSKWEWTIGNPARAANWTDDRPPNRSDTPCLARPPQTLTVPNMRINVVRRLAALGDQACIDALANLA